MNSDARMNQILELPGENLKEATMKMTLKNNTGAREVTQ